MAEKKWAEKKWAEKKCVSENGLRKILDRSNPRMPIASVPCPTGHGDEVGSRNNPQRFATRVAAR
jgi:hypothetical protein